MLPFKLTASSMLAGPLTDGAAARQGISLNKRQPPGRGASSEGGAGLPQLSLRASVPSLGLPSPQVRGGSVGSGVSVTADASSTVLSPAACALLALGRTSAGHMHQRRFFDANGEVVEGGRDAQPPAPTFIESLSLSAAAVEALASGAFLYLRGSSVYHLAVCEQRETDPSNYFTLSASGVTHYWVGPSNILGTTNPHRSSTFTPLVQWEREFRLYHTITRIPFFRRYLLWKVFTCWKKGVNRNKRGKAADVMRTNLFVLNPSLRTTLLALRSRCMDIATLNLFAIDPRATYTLPAFMEAQSAQRVAVAKALTEFADAVRAMVRNAADDVLDAFLVANSIAPDAKMSFMERSSLRAQCRRLTQFIRVADFHTRDSLLQLALDSAAALAAAIAPAPEATPPRIVKTDLVAPPVAGLEAAAAEMAGAAAAIVAARSGKGSGGGGGGGGKGFTPVPLLTVSISFEGVEVEAAPKAASRLKAALASSSAAAAEAAGGAAAEPPAPRPAFSLDPQLSAVKAALADALSDAMVVISAPPQLLTHSDMSPYVLAANDDSGSSDVQPPEELLDLTEAVLAHPQFRKLSGVITGGVANAFAAVKEFCQEFVPFGQTFLANEALLGAGSSSNGAEVAYKGGTSLEELEAAIASYNAQIAQFSTMPTQGDIGIVRVESAAMKAHFTPSPTKCLAAIRELTPVLMRGLCASLVDALRSKYIILASSPVEVEPFVLKVSTLESCAEALPAFRERDAAVRALGQLMIDNGWPVADDLKATFRVLKDSLVDLEAAVGKAEASLEADTQKFAKKVDDAVPVLKRNVLAVRERLDDPLVASADAPPAKVVKFLREQGARMDELRAQAAKFSTYQAQLKQPVAEMEVVEEVHADLSVKLKLWETAGEFASATTAWRATSFATIDAEEMGRAVQGFLKVAARTEKVLPGNAAAGKLRSSVEDFKRLLPVVQDLRSKALQPRHWKDIEAAIQGEIDPARDYTLGELLELNVMDHQAAISVIATKAVQEAALVELFSKKVTSVWTAQDFTVNSYKESKEVFILGGVDEVVAALDESLVNINTILGSRFCAPMRAEVESYQARLILLSETLDEWLNCQKQWMYLESIFSADDIKRQLPEESKKFSGVDRSWKAIMKRTSNNPNALVAGTVKGLKETFVRHNEVLEAIQRALEDYLETKRQAFPRFYFLSNEELLEILAQTRDPQAVQPHLRKCFDALTLLEFGKEAGSVDIIAMFSPEKERVELPKNLKARGNVEDWLMEVQKGMVVALNRLMREGVADYARRPRNQWVLAHAAQIVATVAQIQWCRGTEEALRNTVDASGAISAWYDANCAALAELTVLVRSKLTKLERATIVALVTTDVHARDIVESLRDDDVASVGSFTWQQQLRYYWLDDKQDTLVRQSNAAIPYGYEYQGATSRLVITALTDRCWMTITGAYNLKLGASPAGPAGTGKTESSKDLAKAIGIQCIVFNCSDQIDYKMMGKLFSGLAQSGSWTCLDEFNRIDIEVLSVVAQQVQQLRQGVMQGLGEMQFEGRHIKLKPHMVIITMNPGYAGRTELPDNLKVLFRGVSMMVPDYALIAEIILFSEGFDDSKNLSRKMTKLYKLSSEQLSQQRHYDFGMRAVKSVLVMAGSLKRAYPNLTEDVVLIRAMRDSNVPKFLADDLPLFHAIVGDLFPGVVVPDNDTGHLQMAVLAQLGKAGLQVVNEYVDKILQVYETFNVRFGVVLTGRSMAGKTTAYRTLASALTTLKEAGIKHESFQKVHLTVLNPKCISMGELYGEFNPLSQEWTDGLASTIIRGYVADESEDKRWTVFDGPIDALWIENMNTVLDDNMTLCLANGERIKLKPAMRMLFEVGDLDVASPATVSRLGVVFMTPDNLGWQPFVRSWLAREMPSDMPPAVAEHVLELFTSTVDAGLAHRRVHCSEPIATTVIQTGASLCRLFTALLRTCGAKNPETGLAPGYAFAGRSDADVNAAMDTLFAFSYVWTIGGSISSDGHEGFDTFMRTGLKGTLLEKMRWGPGSVYDCFPDTVVPDVPWKRWADVVPAFAYDRTQPYFAMVVPTVDTVRFNFLLVTQLSQLYPVFFTGVTGTGKTVIVQDLLNRASAPDFKDGWRFSPIVVNFSARTAALDVQITIEAKLEKKKKTQLGAPNGKRVVVFVDDVNMPAVEQYGAQPPIELLRQLADHSGVYDRSKLFWKDIVDTVIVGAAAPPGGGRASITQRFSRHFHVLCLPPASDAVLQGIFGAIFSGWAAGFPEDVRSLGGKVVQATIEVFNRVRDTMRPTPAKSHYTFNLRDVAKVFQGVLMIGPKELGGSPDILTRLWAHESMRVFHDRLVDAHDKGIFTALLVELLGRYFGRSGSGWLHADLFESKPLLFVDFLKPALEGSGPYEDARDIPKIVSILDNALDEYNMSNPTTMKLVFFRDAVEHVARVKRILRQPRGNAMLVGVGGSGKQSLTRMACAMSGVTLFQIELTRGYGLLEFREDLKKVMLKTGVEGLPLAFLFGDTQIVQEAFLEDISSVLNTGEVPGVFASDEVAKIIEDLRPVALAAGVSDTKDNILRLFVQRVRDNLHIILTMSPVGSALRVRCRQFPSLINCCTIDWYTPWPADALSSVATRFLETEDLGTPEEKRGICEMCVDIHMTVSSFADRFYAELQRRVYTTPKSYLDLINLYLAMLREKRPQLENQRATLAVGSKKLDETNGVVGSLREELTKMQPFIDQKAREAADLLVRVSKDKIEADKIRTVVEKDAAAVAVQADEVRAIQEDAQRDLDVALPALKAAEKALEKLDKKDISEVKSFAKPPPAVRTVMEAVCLLLGEKMDWDTAKSVLSRSSFMDELLNYDSENVPPERVKKLQRYVQDPDMAVEAVARVSSAAKTLATWVHAVDIYSRVAKEVEPKKLRLAGANAKLASANAVLKSKQDALQEVLDKVASLEAQASAAEAERDKLLNESQLTRDRLERAGKLTTGLATEGVRWKASGEVLDAQITALVGDVLLSAACISYYGAFTGTYRSEMVSYWLDGARKRAIPVSDAYALMTTMGDPVQLRDWQIAGLPSDAVSTDNAILVTRGKRWPLMIDPQEQAKKWVKNMEARAKLTTTRLTNPNMLRSLESCIRLGGALLIEDVGETLDPALEPVLQKAVFTQGGRTLIHLGDSDVDYDPGFRMYMTTKLPNPHYLPEVCIKVTIINFTVTMSGLVDQLLGAVVRKERPDVERKKSDLIISMAKDKRALKDLEDKILALLRNSEGNILDDKVLIDTLGESKELASAIGERLRESERTELEINEMREGYRPIAVRGSLIYFVIADLALIDPMYQFSLAYFVTLYNRCIDLAAKSDVLEERLAALLSYITEASYANVCRGLFETHKLIFSFMQCSSILREAGRIGDAEWSMLLRGAGVVTAAAPNPMADVLPEPGWNLVAALEKGLPELFTGLGAHMASRDALPAWRAWAECADPHATPLPAPWGEKLNQFQRMLIVKAVREEKGIFAVKDFVSQNLGPAFIQSPPVSLSEVMKDAREDTPIIFILSTGADPTGMLFSYARANNYLARLRIISLGQGQGPKAQALIDSACMSGDWVLLQNCHLAKSWMPSLERIVEGLSERTTAATTGAMVTGGPVHPDFRLFLTSMPADYFPVPVLQNGVKITNEPPKGIRANLMRSFAQLDSWTPFETCEGTFEDGSSKLHAWKKLAFGLCFFHAGVQERRKFGPLGFNVKYEFNDSDLDTSLQVLKMLLSEQPAIPWDALRYTSAVLAYGGRVTDFLDLRCVNAIIAQYVCPAILEDDYTFSPSGIYYAPPVGSLDSLTQYASALPLNDNPEIFGLHLNANIASQRSETLVLLDTVLSLQPRSSGGTRGRSPDEIVGDLARVFEAELPPQLRMEEAGPTSFQRKGEHMDSLSTVLSQEMVRFNHLLSVMAVSLSDLQRAIRGEVLLSEELDRMFMALLNNKVPSNWEVAAYPSLKPLASWGKDLHLRMDFMRRWLVKGQPPAFWSSGFFFPQGFLTGALQNHARKYAIAIDTLNFAFNVLDIDGPGDVTPADVPTDGVLVYGLFFDGARWDKAARLVAESRPGEIYSPMPVIHFIPTKDYKPDPKEYSAPVYKTSVRAGVLSTTGASTNYVISVELPTDRDPNTWVLTGAALLTMLND